MKLYKKIIKKGTLELLTGLHIGDSKDSTDIGGVDSPVCRRKDNNQPYIPGSSLKGKMRSLLEIAHGKADTFKDGSHIIGQLFGSINNDAANPSRLIVRDASLTINSATQMQESEFTDMPFTEVKFENVIDRIIGTTKNGGLRQIERVPAGAIFDIEFVINIIAASDAEANEQEVSFLALLNSGIKLLHDDYIGGSGSRGYGQVHIEITETQNKTAENYLDGSQ
jgi:CRISPR-associated protein Csm3